MSGRIHPAVVDLRRIRTHCDVLFNESEVRSRQRGPLRHVRLAPVAMGNLSLGHHTLAVLARRRGKRRIPHQGRGSRLGTRLVRHGEQLLRGSRLRTRHAALSRQLRCSHPNQHCQNREQSLQIGHIVIKPRLVEGVAVFFIQSMEFFDFLRTRIRRQPLAVVGGLLLATFVVGGLAAPLLAPHNPAGIDLLHRLESPSAAHWAGTDELGRDTLSRLLWGARLSLAVSVTVVSVSLALGIAIGGLAGYLGGWIDTALTTFAMNTFLALPGILLAIAFAAFLGPGFSNLVLALAIGGWAGYARLVRAQVMAVRDREYVDAARALGAGGLRTFFRHILPNIAQPILVQAAIGMAGVILAEATLSFLGLGIPAPAPSWGGMLNDARSHLFDSPHLVLFPAAAVAGAVLGFNFLGDALRDQLDPRTRLEMSL